MNKVTGGEPLLDPDAVREEVVARDAETANPFGKDGQLTAVRGARAYLGDRLVRVARPHRLLDPAAGPLIAVRLHVITRKTLGGLHTDLSARVLGESGTPVPGLYAAGEAAGFGGGGMHGYRSLEGTFLGGCLFSGRTAGRAAAAAAGELLAEASGAGRRSCDAKRLRTAILSTRGANVTFIYSLLVMKHARSTGIRAVGPRDGD
jgi:uncharacterized protein